MKLQLVVVAGVLAVVLAACGGASNPKTTRTSTTPAPSGPSSSTTTGPVHATLTGETHVPTANKLFTYTVRATGANGQALEGTVETEFAFSGVVVGREVPPTHRIKHGHLRDQVTFPSSAIGQPLELQTVVHTSEGTVTLDWPVMVKP